VRISALYNKIRKIGIGVVYRVSSVFQVLALVLQPSSSEICTLPCPMAQRGGYPKLLVMTWIPPSAQHFLKVASRSSSLTSMADLWIMRESVLAKVALRALKRLGRQPVFQSSCSARVSSRQWPGRRVLIVRWKMVCRRQNRALLDVNYF
jgi:hypothetical protein